MPRAFLIKKLSPVKDLDMRCNSSERGSPLDSSYDQSSDVSLSEVKEPFDLSLPSGKNEPEDRRNAPPAVKSFSPIIVSSSSPRRTMPMGERGSNPSSHFVVKPLLENWAQRPLWPPPVNFSFYLFPNTEFFAPQGRFTPLQPLTSGLPMTNSFHMDRHPGRGGNREGQASPDSSSQGIKELDEGPVNEQALHAARHQCADCQKTYATYSGLSKHRQFHCVVQPKRAFNCKHCSKVYVSLGALKMHIRTHTLPCKCSVCGKAFSRPWLLQGHIRTHTGEKPFACIHCNRAFADRSNLRAHLQTHSDVKKYSCGACGKSFSRMSLLVKHNDSGCSSSVIKRPAASLQTHSDVKCSCNVYGKY